MRRLVLGLLGAGLVGVGAGCFDFTGTLCGGEYGECVEGYVCDSTGRCQVEGSMVADGGQTDGGQDDGGLDDGGQDDGGQDDGGQTDGGQTDGGQTDGGQIDGGQTDAGGECASGTVEACENQEGACLGGTRTCSAAGVWGPCSIAPVVESCNGIDDDCDGARDELDNSGPYVLATNVNAFQWVPTDGGYVATMLNNPGGPELPQVLLQLYDAALSPVPGAQILDGGGRANEPTVSAFNDSAYVSWVSQSGGIQTVHLAQMPLDGGPTAQVSVASSTAVNFTTAPHTPDLSSDNILVVWQSDSRVWGMTVSPALVKLTSPTPIGPTLASAIAFDQAVAPSSPAGFRALYSWYDDAAETYYLDAVAVSPALTVAAPYTHYEFDGLGPVPSMIGMDLAGTEVAISWEAGGMGFISPDGGSAITQFGPVVNSLDVATVEGRPIAAFERPSQTVVGVDLSSTQTFDGGQVLVPTGAGAPSVAPAGAGRIAVAYRTPAGEIHGVFRCAPSGTSSQTAEETP